MSLGFYMKGKVRKPENLVKAAQQMAKDMGYRIEVEEDGLNVNMCPMGNLGVTWTKGGKLSREYQVEVECRTSPVGPGFHKAALEFAEKLDIKGLEVMDETEYYNHRDFEKMRREHFYAWVAMLAKISSDKLKEDGSGQMLVCWDLDSYAPESMDRTLVTPMGRFTADALAGLVDSQGIEALAHRFFLWENEEKDALFYRNCAINILWEYCYYRPSSCSEAYKEINSDILNYLERAYALDHKVPLPYEAYREVCGLHEKEPVIPEDCEKLSFEFPIGYRKGMVTEPIDALRLVLPGSYQYEWEDNDGGGAARYCDMFEESPIWRVSVFHAGRDILKFMGNGDTLNDMEEKDLKNGRLRFGWVELGKDSEGEDMYMMQCQVISGSALFLITVTYFDQEDREGIAELLRRISVAPKKE